MGKTARIELITDSDVIGAVQHQVMPGDLREQRVLIQHGVNKGELNVGIDARQCRFC
jgi:cell shape-determining protein MreC